MTPEQLASISQEVWVWVLPVVWITLAVVVGVGVGLIAAVLIRKWVFRAAKPLGAARAGLLARVVSWSAFGGIVLMALSATGLELSNALTWVAGAAGIFGVAIGFASQTSATNVISGLFLLGEKPFEEGDVIQVQGVTGAVLAVDLLSVKLRTFDNTFVRVPNELVMKNTIINLSRFPIRRMDVVVRLRPGVDLDAVRAVLHQVAADVDRVLIEPSPSVLFVGLVEGGVEVNLTAWTQRERFGESKAAFSLRMMRDLDAAGIDVIGSRREVVTR
ncbi:MAG: mechanosensitive ion channel family protein [Myxococcota bacterium]